jgi:hypothetical protein
MSSQDEWKTYSLDSRIKVKLSDVLQAIVNKIESVDDTDRKNLLNGFNKLVVETLTKLNKSNDNAFYIYSENGKDYYLDVYNFVPMERQIFIKDDESDQFWSEAFKWENESFKTLHAIIIKRLWLLSSFLMYGGYKNDTGDDVYEYYYKVKVGEDHQVARDDILNTYIPKLKNIYVEFKNRQHKLNLRKKFQQKVEERKQKKVEAKKEPIVKEQKKKVVVQGPKVIVPEGVLVTSTPAPWAKN